MKISSNDNIYFRSGITKQILSIERNTEPMKIRKYFINSNDKDWSDFNNIDFKNNKACALASWLCAQIFKEFRNKHDYRGLYCVQHCIFPHDLYVFNNNELTAKLKTSKPSKTYFCDLFGGTDIIKGKYMHANSVFMTNKYSSLDELNELSEQDKKCNYHSSGHFLNYFVHEWLHSIQGKILYNLLTYRNSGHYQNTYREYLQLRLNKKENEIVADVLGKYAARNSEKPQYPEVFAEAWTKFICDSLDEDCIHFKKDPIVELENTPKEFQTILKKVSNITFYDFKGNKK